MPPKKGEPSKKTVEKAKQKVVEDKTFGLKNKKGAKTQKYIQTIEKQVIHGNKSAKELEKLKDAKSTKKEEKQRELEELNTLFRPVTELQKVAAGVDPKSVLCVFFKQGQCSKGNKCKFSHDLATARKTEKKSLYVDGTGGDEQEGDGMENWDQSKLEEVVNRKHGAANTGLPPTTIICKHFLDAVESSKYGWFWSCPNGGEKCHYRHALPPGFVLKKDKKKMEEQADKITLEELIENERTALASSSAQTKVTLESFLRWKKKKKLERRKKEEVELEKKRNQYKQGKTMGLSGRLMFEFNPDLVCDDGDDEGGSYFDTSAIRKQNDANDGCDEEQGDDDDSGIFREIKLADFDLDDSDIVDDLPVPVVPSKASHNGPTSHEHVEVGGQDQPSSSTNGALCTGGSDGEGFASNIEIDEELFVNDEDLENLESELQNCEVNTDEESDEEEES